MSLSSLSFASGHDTLSVRQFAVSEQMSALFDLSVLAVSPLDDLDFEAFLGHPASLHLHGGEGDGHPRTWTGICSHFEQRQAESTGLSTYVVRIVPELWLLTQRHDCRVFQHRSIPEIAEKILAHWKIEPILELDTARYPRLEYRVQYNETDYAFLSRLLEEAGISLHFSHQHEGKRTRVVLCDKPGSREPRAGGPIHYVDHPNPEARAHYLSDLTVSRAITPGAYTIRDFDFRRRSDFALHGDARSVPGVEGKLEQYHYQPGAFLVEKHGHGAAHDHGHHDEKEGSALAERGLEAHRAHREQIRFRTNLLSLSPGTVFSISGHPRESLGPKHPLLAVEQRIEGTPGGEWTITGTAVPTGVPYRPIRHTPRPKIAGVQSAVVVGPAGEEIHTDEHGRVRVHFPWDRHGKRDEHSSCWIRVSQGWAGSGFGMIVLPRVGQEVTVGFFEGDPDQPVVIGRVYNNDNPTPYKLPEHKTRSAWRSRSTPSEGDEPAYNEILFEDKAGAELVAIRAQRDLHKQVRANEVERIGASHSVTVGKSRTTHVGASDTTSVGHRHSVTVASASGGATHLTMSDRRIVCTTGEATVTFDGDDLSLEAKGNVTIVSREGDVIIKGGPNVKINTD